MAFSLFSKSAYLSLSNPDILRHDNARHRVFEVLALCVKTYEDSLGSQAAIFQNLRYMDHLAEPMADFLAILHESYGNSQVADDVLM